MPTTPSQYSGLPNKLVRAANGVDYAYRDTGPEATGVPLVLFQHFRGNLDNWDPALIDALATARRVITFDNAGVGGSTGTTPDSVEQMARDAIAFIAAMELGQVDLLGFSIGSFIAQHRDDPASRAHRPQIHRQVTRMYQPPSAKPPPGTRMATGPQIPVMREQLRGEQNERKPAKV